ncbi:MAG: DEAD/DEAH box helicase, partial [Pyrinomonadaceae bacterium]
MGTKLQFVAEENTTYAEVALPLPLRKNFTYSLATELSKNARPGMRVQVEFGSRRLIGCITELKRTLEAETEINLSEIKPVLQLIDSEPIVSEEILELTKWAADYYRTSHGEMIKAALPSGINSKITRHFSVTESGANAYEIMRASKKRDLLKRILNSPGISHKEVRKEFGKSADRIINELIKQQSITGIFKTGFATAKSKTQIGVEICTENAGGFKLTRAQEEVFEYLAKAKSAILLTKVVAETGHGVSVIEALVKRGLIKKVDIKIRRNPHKRAKDEEYRELKLTKDQTAAFDEIKKSLGKEFKPFLLFGVTGSGKTEVYIRAMRNALEQGKTALMLVPEIALTPVFSRRLRSVFGDLVAIIHSSLSTGERFDEWQRIRKSEAKVVIGTRSAV